VRRKVDNPDNVSLDLNNATPASQKRHDRRMGLRIAFAAFVVVFALWQTDSAILFPFRLLVTYVHEMAHGLAALLTGGQFISFHVLGNGGGVAFTDGGSEHLILPAGYLGSALFGAVLLYAAHRVRRVQWATFVLGGFFVVTALFLGRGGGGSIDAAVTSMFALMIGVIAGIGLIALGRYGSRLVNVVALNTLAFIVGFNVISDFLWLLRDLPAGLGDIQNDAQVMAILTNTATLNWIVVWAAIAMLVMGIAAIFAFVDAEPHNTKLSYPVSGIVENEVIRRG
jgi:hypothetical protein